MYNFIITFINTYGYIAVFLLILLENIFPPIPSELILTFSGYCAYQTDLDIIILIILSSISSLIGAIILYFIGRYINIYKLGKILKIKTLNINKSIDFFNNKGKISILYSRLIPIVRSLISIPAGMSKMNFLIFCIYTFIGSFIWNSILILLGNIFGENYLVINNFFTNHYKIILIIILFTVVLFKYKKRITIIK